MDHPADSEPRRVHLPLQVDVHPTTTPLPPLLARWIEDVLGSPVPAESRATCEDCVMCRPAPDPQLESLRFSPDARCCSYSPSLPNYSVGLILGSASGSTARGRAEVERRVSARMGATPLGLSPSRRYSVDYQAVDNSDFGKRSDIVCPYWERDTSACGVWRHRTSSCATWFCHHERRALGRRFWEQAQSLLRSVEEDVAVYCALELGLDANSSLHLAMGREGRLEPRTRSGWIDPEGPLDERTARRLWGSWYGREGEFYRRCGTIAESLDATRLREIGGVRLAWAERSLRSTFTGLSDRTIPRVLCLSNVVVTPLDSGDVSVHTESTPFDPLLLSPNALDALAVFDGRDTAEAVIAARAQGLALDDDMLRRLIDQGVLAAPDGGDLPPRERSHAPIELETRLCFFRNFRGSEIRMGYRSGEGGQPIFELDCGVKQISFEEAELIAFGRRLVDFQDGFRARDAMDWAPPGVTYSWERVRELLEALVADNVLQIVGS